MCGRYTLHKNADDIARRYNLATTPKNIRDNYNVAPGQVMPVIVKPSGQPELRMMKWGFVPVWAKDSKMGYRLINARDDTIFDKPMWRSAVLKKRCIVPADGFYEWKISDRGPKAHKTPFYIHPKQTSMFSLAGIWSSWKGPEGQTLESYSIITTEPNKEMRPIHDRMPVILDKSKEASWLDTENTDRSSVESMMCPMGDGELSIVQVSTDVNSPKNNDEHLIQPATAS